MNVFWKLWKKRSQKASKEPEQILVRVRFFALYHHRVRGESKLGARESAWERRSKIFSAGAHLILSFSHRVASGWRFFAQQNTWRAATASFRFSQSPWKLDRFAPHSLLYSAESMLYTRSLSLPLKNLTETLPTIASHFRWPKYTLTERTRLEHRAHYSLSLVSQQLFMASRLPGLPNGPLLLRVCTTRVANSANCILVGLSRPPARLFLSPGPNRLYSFAT